MNNVPIDLRRDIKRHLFWDLVKRMPMFEKMDDQLLYAVCDCLKPVLCTEGSLIYREGDPVDHMVFLIRGNLLTMATNGRRTGFFNCVNLHAGDFCGEELLTWALYPNSSLCLPASTRTVKAVTDVEAFALIADNLKSVASQFRRLHRKQLRHAFSFNVCSVPSTKNFEFEITFSMALASTHNIGGHGLPVSYKQHGVDISGENLIMLGGNKKTGCEMLWLMKGGVLQV